MKKRFMLATNKMSRAEDELVVDYCKSKGFGWWHYLDGVWLLVTYNESATSEMVRDEINDLFETKKTLIVMEIGQEQVSMWSGYGTKEMFEWLHEDGWASLD